MLATAAMCAVMFDFAGLWVNLLPDELKAEIHTELGFDPWDDKQYDAMATVLGAAAESDARTAWLALIEAEKRYDQMSAQEIIDETLDCAKRLCSLLRASTLPNTTTRSAASTLPRPALPRRRSPWGS